MVILTYLLTLGACFCLVGLKTSIYIRQKRKMSFRKVNIIVLVLAAVLFLLVLHHNFLGLSSLLRNEVSGMGALTNALASVEDPEFPVSQHSKLHY